MAIWLGSGGGIRLGRSESEPFFTEIQPSDVDAGASRFSIERAAGEIITGDRIWIQRVDAQGAPSTSLLTFVAPSGWSDNKRYNDGEWYVAVDEVGGIRLFKSWSEALEGDSRQAVALSAIGAGYRLKITLRDTQDRRCIAQTTAWELNTNREVADITSLGEGFQKNMATMVSGSGRLSCLFDAGHDFCDDGSLSQEKAIYLHRLALRQEIGSNFTGVFLLKQDAYIPLGKSDDVQGRELFYTCECIITDVALTVTPEDLLRSEISFVTTDKIKLIYSLPSDYLLQENSDKVLQQSGFGVLLEFSG